MDIVADENVDIQIVASLRLAGHSLVYVRESDSAPRFRASRTWTKTSGRS